MELWLRFYNASLICGQGVDSHNTLQINIQGFSCFPCFINTYKKFKNNYLVQLNSMTILPKDTGITYSEIPLFILKRLDDDD